MRMHKLGRTVAQLLLVSLLLVGPARAARTPTRAEAGAVRAAALRSLQGSGWKVGHIRISTVRAPDGYASTAVDNVMTGVGGEMILRYRGGRWGRLFLGQNDFCTVHAPRAVLDDLGFMCSKPALSIKPATVARGGRVTFAGSHFLPGANVVLYVGPPASEGQRIGAARVSGSGAFSTTFAVARSARAGRYIAIACQSSCTIKATASFRIG